MAKLTLPDGWKRLNLGSVCDVVIGGTPHRKSTELWKNGRYPWVKVGDLNNGVVESTEELISDAGIRNSNAKLIPKGTMLLSFKLSLGKVGIAGVDLYTNEAVAALIPKPGQQILAHYLFYLFQAIDLTEFARDAGKGKTVNKDILQKLGIPVPPLPIQRAIVIILSQADAICHKHAFANKMTGNILATIFEDMLASPSTDRKWQLVALGDSIIEIRNGIGRRRKQVENEGTIVLRIQDVEDGWIDYSSPNRIPLEEQEKKIFQLEQGDLLLVRVNGNKRLVGRNTIFRGHPEIVTFNDHLMRIRLNPEHFLPEYVDAYLRSPLGQREIERQVVTSAGNHSINHSGIQSIQIPNIPLDKQLWFAQIYDDFLQQANKFANGVVTSEALFQVVLSRAFNGELTAEWEKIYADLITTEVARLERRPKWVLLKLITEQQQRQAAPLGITSLMKYTFLAQQEGQFLRQPINHYYNFVPYHFGPFAKKLYKDLEQLETEGWVTVKRATDDDPEAPERIEISLASNRVDEVKDAIAELSEDELADLTAVIEQYGDLSHAELLDTVYGQYPAYAQKSRLKRR